MSYIKQLQTENEQLKKQIEDINKLSTEYLQYLSLPKFRGIDNDFCAVSTDIYWKIWEIRNISMQ